MQLDYHYYAIYQLAALAGFNSGDAETIAYASQYVDDSTEGDPIVPFPDQHFDTVRTAHYNLGLVYHSQRRFDEAIARYRRALELEPDFAEAHNNLGVSLGTQGSLDEAVFHFRRALEIDPAYEGARRNLAFALKKMGQD